jgi:arylsulfatase A-like enzyme
MPSRREFLGCTAAALFAAPAQKRPNIVVLYTDDQRFDTIRAWGNREIHTPAMDRLAANGCSFTHTFTMGGTHGAICVPSRAMLMTGRSLFHVARDIMAPNAPQTFVPFPRLLAEAGYRTFMSGKWHNGPEFFAKTWTQGASNVFFGGMADHFATETSDFSFSGRGPARVSKEFASTQFTDAALRFLETRDQSKPYLLYVAFTAPHDPRTAPKRFQDLYPPDKITLPPNFKPGHPFDNGELKVRDELLAGFPRKPEEVRQHLADYYAMISAVDHEIGRILDAVGENTYVFFAGDNGLAVGQHGLIGKQNLYDHSWRVPMIVQGPGVPRGKRVDALTYIYDICPTVCELGGVKPPADVEARSLRPLWTGKGKGRASVFAAYRNLQRAVRTDRWKLIEYNVDGKRTTQLFDLLEDPWELRDLSATNGKRVQEMRRMLRAEMKRFEDPADLDAAEWKAI